MQISLVGQRIGHYRVDELIGRGGMASVYRGHDEMLSREVALKVLNPDADHSVERFRTEALALARIGHPGIAAVYQLLQHDDHLVMAMELVRGETLHQLCARDGAQPPIRAAEICMEALAALTRAHGAGVVHRDLKPTNLMMTGEGLKIMDFGIARLEGTARLTLAGMAMGTPAYMAPEQIQGKEVDARTDLYTMGVLFYWLVTGALPFRGETQYAMVQAQLNDPPTPAASVKPELPSWVDTIVTRALQKHPEQRFQTALDFHEALRRCVAPQASPVRSARHQTGRWIVGAVAASVCGLVWLQIKPAAAPPEVTATAVAVGTAPTAEVSYAPLPAAVAPARPTPVSAASTAPARSRAVAPVQPEASARAPVKTLPVAAPAPSPETPTALFDQVRLLVTNGGRTTDREVVLRFAENRITAIPPGGGAAVTTLAYGDIVKATYARGRSPQWDTSLSAPPDRMGIPGFAGLPKLPAFLGRTRNWLVVQTRNSHAIFRLDGEDWQSVLDNFESRAGVKVVRRPAGEK